MKIKVILKDENNQEVPNGAYVFESEHLPIVGQHLYFSRTEIIQIEKIMYVPPLHEMECDFIVQGRRSEF